MKFHQQAEGWTYEHDGNHQVTYIKRPEEIGGGFVTIDFTYRRFSTGMGAFGPWVNTNKTYTGRGWKDRLISDACEYIEKVMTS